MCKVKLRDWSIQVAITLCQTAVYLAWMQDFNNHNNTALDMVVHESLTDANYERVLLNDMLPESSMQIWQHHQFN